MSNINYTKNFLINSRVDKGPNITSLDYYKPYIEAENNGLDFKDCSEIYSKCHISMPSLLSFLETY